MRVGAPRLEDRLAPGEPPYKSRGEAQVGRLLDRYGLPFIYEQPLVLYDRERWRTWHPDFTLLGRSGRGYGPLILEYAGMPDRPDYMKGVRYKQVAYATNAVPAMFIYPRDLTGPSWPARLAGRILDRYRAAGSLRRYQAKSRVRPSMGRPYSRSRSYRR